MEGLLSVLPPQPRFQPRYELFRLLCPFIFVVPFGLPLPDSVRPQFYRTAWPLLMRSGPFFHDEVNRNQYPHHLQRHGGQRAVRGTHPERDESLHPSWSLLVLLMLKRLLPYGHDRCTAFLRRSAVFWPYWWSPLGSQPSSRVGPSSCWCQSKPQVLHDLAGLYVRTFDVHGQAIQQIWGFTLTLICSLETN
jgi:hypothetical protein